MDKNTVKIYFSNNILLLDWTYMYERGHKGFANQYCACWSTKFITLLGFVGLGAVVIIFLKILFLEYRYRGQRFCPNKCARIF